MIHVHRGWRRMSLLSLCLVFLMSTGAPLGLAADDEKNGKDEKKEEGLPLEPSRTIEFTTDEATWLSLDVDPDGRILVFELLGDLYNLPIEGGEATPLTTGMAFDSQPSYSPDGDWIAFISDRDGSENLWICRNDGSDSRKLSDDPSASEFASPTWTRDGEYVIVSRSTWGMRTFELWMYHLKGGAGVQLTKAKATPKTPPQERHNAIGVRVSPDGKYLYYATKRGGFAYNADFPLWQIARRDRVTGDEDILTRAPGSAIRPLLSPDGKLLIYGTRHDAQTGLRIRNLETGEDRWFKYPVQRDDQESRFTRDLLPGYAFMPNGKEVVLTYGGKIHRINIRTGKEREIPFRATVTQKVGPRLHFPKRVEQGPVRARLIQNPALSPDGRRLVFSALTHLYVMNLPNGKPRRLTYGEGREFQPSWSPNGRSVAYVSWSEDGGHIWSVSSDGGKPRKLTRTAAFYAEPVGPRWRSHRGAARAGPRTGSDGVRFRPAGRHGPDLDPSERRRGEPDPAGARGRQTALHEGEGPYLSFSERGAVQPRGAARPGVDTFRRHRSAGSSESHRSGAVLRRGAGSGQRCSHQPGRALGPCTRRQPALRHGGAARRW